MGYANLRAGQHEELRQKRAVIGTYVPADLFERRSFYSSHRRANRELGNLVHGLADISADGDIYVFESFLEKLHIDTTPDVRVTTLEIGFTYDERKDAMRTFKKVLDSGLMLRCNSSYFSPMIQRGEFDTELEYRVEEKGMDTLRWLVGRFRKNVQTLGIRGVSGFKYKLEL